MMFDFMKEFGGEAGTPRCQRICEVFVVEQEEQYSAKNIKQ